MPVSKPQKQNGPLNTSGGSRPIPDPTELTTKLVDKGFLNLRELIEARLNAMDKAIELLQGATDKLPSKIDASVNQLRELHEEKFSSIQTQFTERDTRTEQTSRDSKVAVDAALQAAKEAVGEQNKSNALAIAKSEAAFTKQIDQIGVIISTLAKGIDDKIDDIKSRLQTIEGHKKGASDSWGYLIGAIGMVVGVVSIVAILWLHH